MSTLGRDWDSERYREYARAGLAPGEAEIRPPIPHWCADVELSTQTNDDWHIWSLQNPGQEIIVDRQQSDGQAVFDLDEVR